MTTARRSFIPAETKPPADLSSGRRPLAPLEWLTLIHLGTLTLLATWAFGGGADWARRLIAGWGSLGALLTIAALLDRRRARDVARNALRWLWPLAMFNVLVLVSLLNPSFTEKILAGEKLLAHTGALHPGLPSTAHPATSREHLWLFDAIFLSCANLGLIIRRRRALRGLLLLLCGNAMVLAVFGTFQKLASHGLYFGLVPSPNPRFFATFVYGNHWAAFVVLALAACAGLMFHYARQGHAESLEHSPALMGVIALLLMAVTPALCGSRAGVILVGVVLAACGMHAFVRVLQFRQQHQESRALPLAGLALFAGLAVGGSIYLGRESLRERWNDTRQQLQSSLLDNRLELYRDTWQLAARQPAYGWGLGTYGQVFMLVRPRPLEPTRQYERSYVDAHSDWLQALAEVGFTGTILLGLHGLLPLLGLRRRHWQDPVTAYALGGCGLILLYAMVEFPFGNPAVVLTWWTCFFCAVQHARLQDRPTAR